jgi:hypothetical protein
MEGFGLFPEPGGAGQSFHPFDVLFQGAKDLAVTGRRDLGLPQDLHTDLSLELAEQGRFLGNMEPGWPPRTGTNLSSEEGAFPSRWEDMALCRFP